MQNVKNQLNKYITPVDNDDKSIFPQQYAIDHVLLKKKF